MAIYTPNYNFVEPFENDSYQVKVQNENINMIDAELAGIESSKVDKVAGKGLSANDYTTPEKERLAGLENYDDTAVKAIIDTKVDKVAGKELSANDYTTPEKEKLKSLENYDDTAVKVLVDTKVDKVAGKGLSTNDYTTPEKEKLKSLENYDDTAVKVLVDTKVDKEAGKGLSTNDFTTQEQVKLQGVEAGANKYIHPTNAGNKHIPTGGASGDILCYSADGTAKWGDTAKIALDAKDSAKLGGKIESQLDVATAVEAENSGKLDGKDSSHYICHHNRLDNSDFTNPVNQRGVSGTITKLGYFLDRWKLYTGTVTLTPQGLALKAGTRILQVTLNIPSSYKQSIGIVSGKAHTALPTGGGGGNFDIVADTDCVIAWAKFEEGTIATPYQPKGYAVELAECLRYFERIGGDVNILDLGDIVKADSWFHGVVNYSQKRIVPTIAYPTVSEAEVLFGYGYNSIAEVRAPAVAIKAQQNISRTTAFVKVDIIPVSHSGHAILVQKTGATKAHIDISADL